MSMSIITSLTTLMQEIALWNQMLAQTPGSHRSRAQTALVCEMRSDSDSSTEAWWDAAVEYTKVYLSPKRNDSKNKRYEKKS